MINLLPPELKKSYQYAGKNVRLRRWVVAFAIAFVGLGAITTYGLLDLQRSTKNYKQKITASEQTLKSENYTQTQEQIQDISGSFQLAVKVLGQEMLFSKLLKQIATIMPAKSNLTGLNISQDQGGMDISAVASDYNTATQVQVNLSDPNNKIFSKADIVSISCSGGSDPNYPCSVNVRALFGDNSQFLFINSEGDKQ